jgi:hypothetical protein
MYCGADGRIIGGASMTRSVDLYDSDSQCVPTPVPDDVLAAIYKVRTWLADHNIYHYGLDDLIEAMKEHDSKR